MCNVCYSFQQGLTDFMIMGIRGKAEAYISPKFRHESAKTKERRVDRFTVSDFNE